jgi:hypothetical protein
MIHVPKHTEVTVRHAESKVLLLIDGRLALSIPWQQAQLLGKAIQVKANQAEEVAKHEQVAMDHAMMLRAGFPFGLATDARIQAEGEKAAVLDRSLRRYMPNKIHPSIQSGLKFGVPTLSPGKQKKPDGRS